MNSQNDAAIAQFIAVTACENDVAEAWLRQCAWDVDQAVQRYYDSGMAPRPPHMRPPQQPVIHTTYRANKNHDDDDDDDDDVDPKQNDSDFETATPVKKSNNNNIDDDGTKKAAKKNLDDLFGPDTSYMITDKPLQVARDVALAANAGKPRWVMATVQREGSFLGSALNRDVFHDANCQTVLKENFIVWHGTTSGPHDTRHGQVFLNQYKIDAEVVVAIINPVTGEKASVFRYKHWVRDGGAGFDPYNFLDDVMSFLDTHCITANTNATGPGSLTPMKEEAQAVPQQPVVDDDTDEMDEEAMIQAAIAASMDAWEPRHPPGKYVTEDPDAPLEGATATCRIRFPDGSMHNMRCVLSGPAEALYDYIYGAMQKTSTNATKSGFQVRAGGMPPRTIPNTPAALNEVGITGNTVLTVAFV
eukprot:PhM_4_TR11523/c0_g1_i1/m.92832